MPAISVFDENEKACFQPALIEMIRDMELKSGSGFRGSLKSLLWVNILHDAPAKQIVEAMLPNL